MIILSFSCTFCYVFCWEYYPASYRWDFTNNCYFGFDHDINFTCSPSKGLLHDNSLVGYWKLDEGSGVMALDSSGNGNDGEIHEASWVEGKYGKALLFDGFNSFLEIPHSESLNIQVGITISFWITLCSSGL